MECRQQSTNHCHSKPVSDFPNADMFSRLLPGRPMSEKSDEYEPAVAGMALDLML